MPTELEHRREVLGKARSDYVPIESRCLKCENELLTARPRAGRAARGHCQIWARDAGEGGTDASGGRGEPAGPAHRLDTLRRERGPQR